MVDISINSIHWADLEEVYSEMLDLYEICDDWKGRVVQEADALIKNSNRYLVVQQATGVDWELIASLHNLESGGDFAKTIRDGGAIRAATWEADTINALKEQGVTDAFKNNPVDSQKEEFACWIAEKWNGFAYRKYNYGPTPYLWSGTNFYVKGKYVADGKYDPNAVSKQVGFVPLYMELRGASHSDDVGPPPIEEPSNCPIMAICEFFMNIGKWILGLFGKK